MLENEILIETLWVARDDIMSFGTFFSIGYVSCYRREGDVPPVRHASCAQTCGVFREISLFSPSQCD